jgi:hypothetical protein
MCCPKEHALSGSQTLEWMGWDGMGWTGDGTKWEPPWKKQAAETGQDTKKMGMRG